MEVNETISILFRMLLEEQFDSLSALAWRSVVLLTGPLQETRRRTVSEKNESILQYDE